MEKIIIISALWCPSCLIMYKRFDDALKEYVDYKVTRLDYDLNAVEVSKLNPGKILPILIFMKDDIELGRIKGEKSTKEIVSFIKDHQND